MTAREFLIQELEKSDSYFCEESDCIDGHDAISTVIKAMEKYAKYKSRPRRS